MSSATCTCGKKVSSEDVFTYAGETLCRECYLGKEDMGPLGEQFHACSKCGHMIHQFTAFCPSCKVAVREIGKVENVARGSATKGIAFVVGIVVLALAAMVMGNFAGDRGKSIALIIPMGIGAFALGVDGLLGLLYFRFFAVVRFVQGLYGLALGTLSFLLSVLIFYLMWA